MSQSGSGGSQQRFVMPTVCALAFTAAVGTATALGWTKGGIGTALVIIGIGCTLLVGIFRDQLSQATRRQAMVGTLLTSLIFAGVLAASWGFGRPTPVLDVRELSVPEQRKLDGINSSCGEPNIERLTAFGSTRIHSAYVAATGIGNTDFVAALVSPATVRAAYGSETRLVVLECDGTQWHETHTEDGSDGCGAELAVTQLRDHAREEILYTSVCGSGGFLDFRLLGVMDSDEGVEVIERGGAIYQGDVSQVRNRLVIEGGSGYREELTWNGERFRSERTASVVPAGEGLVVKFWWDENGGHSDLVEIPAEVGERVYFYWDRDRNTDTAAQSYRILASMSDPRAEFAEDERGETYLVLSAPDISIPVRIIRNGYDLDFTIDVTVTT